MASDQRGYNIPGIDYPRVLLEKEMKNCGAVFVKVLPHDLFRYLKIKGAQGLRSPFYKLLYLFFPVPTFYLLPKSFLEKHAYWWIVVAKKPE